MKVMDNCRFSLTIGLCLAGVFSRGSAAELVFHAPFDGSAVAAVASFAPIALGALSARLGTHGFELGFALMGAVTFVAALAYGAAAAFTFNADRKSADQV